MSEALTARQTQILKAIIDEYIETADAVGSENLEKKYSLGVSPATIRNEMMELTRLGYLRQPHTSAGRMPTPKAMKFYVDQLMEEKQMSVAEEVKVREGVLGKKEDIDELLDEATRALAQSTRALAVAALDEEDKVWRSGYSNIFLNPEFTDLEDLSSLFSFLEEIKMMHELFFERMTGLTPVEVIFGEELGWPALTSIGVVGTRINIGGRHGALGVIGPARLPYPRVIPVVRYFKNLIEQVANPRVG